MTTKQSEDELPSWARSNAPTTMESEDQGGKNNNNETNRHHKSIVGKVDESIPMWARDDYGDEKHAATYGAIETTADSNGWTKQKNDRANNDQKEYFNLPSTQCLLQVSKAFDMYGIVTCIRLLAMQLLPLFFVPLHSFGWLQVVLRLYLSVFCTLFTMVQLEVPLAFLQKSNLLQNWISRGFLYFFIGLVGMEESYEILVEDLKVKRTPRQHKYGIHTEVMYVPSWTSLLISGSSIMMVVLGGIYIVLGSLCMQQRREKLLLRNAQHSEEEEEEEERSQNTSLHPFSVPPSKCSF